MQWQDIALLVLTLGAGASGWFLRTLWDAVDRLREGMLQLERSLPNIYARRDDVKDMFDQIMNAITEFRQDLKDK